MDSCRFDDFTRGLVTVLSRRGTLGVLAAVLAMLFESFGIGTSGAKKKRAKGCRKVGKKCGHKRNRKCCSHAKCRGGRCKCTGQKKACHGKCIPQSHCCDNADCGGASCEGGVCNCKAPNIVCGSNCVNPNTDDDHCGGCDNACVGAATCQNGACAAGGNYAFVREWDGSESGQAFNQPMGVAVDSVGNVYVSDAGTNRVLKFTANGGFLDVWSSLGGDPNGIGVNRSSGVVYVANLFSASVQGFSDDGTPSVDWTTLPQPAGVAVNASSGEVYVSITGGDDAVQRFQSNGALIETWGAPDYDFLEPEGVAVAPNGDIYVSDTGTCEILRFTADGASLGGWGSEGSDPGQFEDPMGVAVDAATDVYVCDTFNFRIQKFTASGDIVGQFGAEGEGKGDFESPVGVAVSLSGYVYVVDSNLGLVQQFEPVPAP